MIFMGCVMAMLALLSMFDPTPAPPPPNDTLVDRRLWLFLGFAGVNFIIQGTGELLPRDRPGIERALRIANLGVIVLFVLLLGALIRSCATS